MRARPFLFLASRLLATAGLSLALSACASIASGPTQEVAIETDPAGAKCHLTNDVGRWYVGSTPARISVRRTNGELMITCVHPDGAAGLIRVGSNANDFTYGNILTGGLIGTAVDMTTGAAYEYPETITLKLTAREETLPDVSASASEVRGASH